MRRSTALGLIALACTALYGCATPVAQTDACNSLTPALVGGPVPPADSDIAVFRWLGNANYEIAYQGKVYLLDTYYDRTARNHALGFRAADVKRADVILVGHAHFDHISDIGPVSRQTGARVVGTPITIDTAVKLGMPKEQGIVAAGGESLRFGDVTVDAALARHSTIQAGLTDAYAAVYKVEVRPNTPEEEAISKEVRSRGTFAPEVIDKGTLAFGITFANGFKVVAFSSAGPVTEGARQLAQKYGRADVEIVSYQPHAVAERQVEESWPLVDLFKPRLFLPAHHDASFGTWLDLGLTPMFERIRQQLPGTSFIAPLYRSPICVATSGENRGKVVSYRD
jgi:L-ascorbate metabolism protein UlaG (beta-lactamase superfamily)